MLSFLNRFKLIALAGVATVYALFVLWYVPTHPIPQIGALLTNDDGWSGGVQMHQLAPLQNVCRGNTPQDGDHLVELAGYPIRNYADFASVVTKLRNVRLRSGAVRFTTNDISKDIPPDSNLSMVEYVDGKRWVRIWFLKPNSTAPVDGWIPLSTASGAGVSLSLLSFILQGAVLFIAGLAHWTRPTDRPVQAFVALCSLGLMAFVAGNHWWVFAGHPGLVLPFSVSGVLLPAVLLHFAVVCPAPRPFFEKHKVLGLAGIYLLPGLAAFAISCLILMISVLSQPAMSGPFGLTVSNLEAQLAGTMLPVLRGVVLLALGLAFVYFLLTLAVLIWSAQTARNALERNQIRPILWAALFATLPLGYTFYLAVFRHADFALGGTRLPMFTAGLAFTLAYGVGIARFKLMLIDQIVSRGVWYVVCSNGLTVLVCSLIAVGCVNGLQQDLSLFGHTIPIIASLMLSVLVLISFRDALQRGLDRRFFREKYQFDRALQRMNRVVTNVMEPEAIAESLLASCCEVLRIDHAVLYTRRGERPLFRLTSAVGLHDAPVQVQLEDEVQLLLGQDLLLQRIPGGNSPAQILIRRTGSEVMYGLEQKGELAGIVALGAKPNGAGYSAEDVAFVTAMGRIAAVALHCVRVQEDVSRLNDDLQLKMDRISEQERQIVALQRELAATSRTQTGFVEAGEFNRDAIKGDSPAIQQVLETIRKVATTHSSVLVRGESGTGKEMIARLIHQNSPRAGKPLVVAHCAAMSPALLESELFGHVKGAFTDAHEARQGRFAMAHGGTLFLDEIGDISLDVQVKLLRVIQEKTFEPVGSNQTQQADVRILAATHKNLEQLISEGRFREDLYYRLNVISVTLPTLRDRKEDLYELTLHFLRLSSEKTSRSVLQIDPDAIEALQRYDWPGNIRELQNVIERAVVMTEADRVRLIDLPLEIRSPGSRQVPAAKAGLPRPAIPLSLPKQLSLRRQTVGNNLAGDDERELLQTALESCGGNKTEAARALGMPRSTFFSKLKKHGLA